MSRARFAPAVVAAAVTELFQAAPAGAQSAAVPSVTTTIIPVEHLIVRTKKPYIEVKTALETRLGRLDNDVRSLLGENKLDELRTELHKLAGRDGLVIHYVATHGDWLVLNGGRRNGIVYHIGNVLSAVEMTRQNFGAGLYAPLRLAVYEDENGATFEYDKPSTLLAQFHDPKIDEVSHSLDDRLAALVTAVTR
jgi:uncharacterized protein (DUF302 family)